MSNFYREMKEWWQTGVYNRCVWMGCPIRKHPADIVVMQELLLRTKPDLVIECGTRDGGSATFFVSVLRLLGGLDSHIITIDIRDKRHESFLKGPFSNFVHFIQGSSVDKSVVQKVKELSSPYKKIMVDLDSNHSYSHVSQELKIYSKFVTPGQYLICEDTCCDVYLGWKDGPHRAVVEFTQKNANFRVDKKCEKLIYTHNPDGYLVKVAV